MEQSRDMIELRLPRKPEYVSVARLSIAGIAGRMNFSYDEVEDIKLAVGEACTSAIQETPAAYASTPVIVRCENDPEAIYIEVINPRVKREGLSEEEGGEEPISRLLMEVLMDEVEVSEGADGMTHVRMVKYAVKDEE